MKTKSTRSRGIMHLAHNRYRIRVKAIDPKTGKSKEVARVVECDGPKEAMARRDEIRAEIERGGAVKAERVRVEAFARKWLHEHAGLRHSTRLRYAEHLDAIIDGLGDYYLDALTPEDVEQWLAQKAKSGLSGHTCAGMLRVLRTVTKNAQRTLRLPFYPCDGVKAPKVRKYTFEEPNALTADELRRVYDEMRRSEARWFSLFAVLAFTGMRFCEAAGLRWGDIDMETGAVRIRRTVYRGVVTEDTKTDAGRRLVMLPPEVLRALGEAGKADAWVFPSDEGTPLSTGILNKPMARAMKRAGIASRATVHGLRRTLNTLALQVAPGELVRKVLGHADTAMTLHYFAPDMEARRQLSASVFGLVEGKWKPGPTAPTSAPSTPTGIPNVPN